MEPTKVPDMKIKTNQLSKKSLVEIVDVMREDHFIPDSLLLSFYKYDLASQVAAIRNELEKIGKKAKDGKLSRKAYAVLCNKESKLVALGNKKLKLYEELKDATK